MVSEKYKVLGMSDSPNVITGYANMARNLFTRLQDDERFDLSFFGLQYSGQPTEYMKLENGPLLNFRMLPTGSGRFGEDMLPFYLKKYTPDLTYVLLDSFMVQWMLNLDWSPTKMLMHFPSDGFPIPAGSEPLMKKFDYVVAMSKFAQKQLIDLGINAEYIPAGVETNKFYPLKENEKQRIKEKWSQLMQIDLNGKFVIGCVGRLQGRKFYGELLKVIEKFVEDKNDVVLVIHADPNDPANPGFIMPELLKLRKLTHLVRFTGNKYTLGFTESEMNEVYNLFDVFALTSCLTPDSDIQTSEGVKPIDEIEEGELVLTLDGTYREVEKVNVFDHEGDILKIKADGVPELKITPNHKIFLAKKQRKNTLDKSKIIETEARYASEGDFLLFPIEKYCFKNITKELDTKQFLKKGRNQFGTTFKHPRARGLPAKVKLDKDFGLLAGWYLSEGCSTKDGLAFAFNTKERKNYSLVEKTIKKLFKCTTRLRHNTRHRTILWVNNVAIGRLFKHHFGHGAHNKKIPHFVFASNKEFVDGLIEGLWKGDGCYWERKTYNGHVFELQTVSKQMAWSMFKLLSCIGFKPTIASQSRQSIVWKIRLNGQPDFGKYMGITVTKQKKIKTRIHLDKDYLYLPISKITKTKYSGNVYDLTISGNHTYTSMFCIHNSGEGFGIPFIEAMACEVPVITSDFTTVQEIVSDNKAGIAVPVKNTITGTYNVERGIVDLDKFTEALQSLYDNAIERKRLGKNGRTAAIRDYDWSKVVYKKWNSYLLKILEE